MQSLSKNNFGREMSHSLPNLHANGWSSPSAFPSIEELEYGMKTMMSPIISQQHDFWSSSIKATKMKPSLRVETTTPIVKRKRRYSTFEAELSPDSPTLRRETLSADNVCAERPAKTLVMTPQPRRMRRQIQYARCVLCALNGNHRSMFSSTPGG